MRRNRRKKLKMRTTKSLRTPLKRSRRAVISWGRLMSRDSLPDSKFWCSQCAVQCSILRVPFWALTRPVKVGTNSLSTNTCCVSRSKLRLLDGMLRTQSTIAPSALLLCTFSLAFMSSATCLLSSLSEAQDTQTQKKEPYSQEGSVSWQFCSWSLTEQLLFLLLQPLSTIRKKWVTFTSFG